MQNSIKEYTMNLIYAHERLEPSIFLAGPTPRDSKTKSWRPEALRILEKNNFKGTVYIPEDRVLRDNFDYDDQVHWEWSALETSTVIIFWIPRNMINMPALTTNVEFGQYVRTGRVLLGYPEEAEKMTYLHVLAERFSVPIFHDLEALIVHAINSVE